MLLVQSEEMVDLSLTFHTCVSAARLFLGVRVDAAALGGPCDQLNMSDFCLFITHTHASPAPADESRHRCDKYVVLVPRRRNNGRKNEPRRDEAVSDAFCLEFGEKPTVNVEQFEPVCLKRTSPVFLFLLTAPG